MSSDHIEQAKDLRTFKAMPRPENLSLQHMPPEIILEVFGLLDSLSEVEDLMLAAPIFLHTWRRHLAVPYAAVVARSTICYPEALQLATIQDKDLPTDKALPCGEPLVALHTRVLRNARVAAFVFGLWRDFMQCGTEGFFGVSVTEQARFHRAFYLWWTFVIAWQAEKARVSAVRFFHSFFDSTQPQVVEMIRESALWFIILDGPTLKSSPTSILTPALDSERLFDLEWSSVCAYIGHDWQKWLRHSDESNYIRIQNRGLSSCFLDIYQH
ncbi:MAG: hypothetical protein Q9191_007771 [Dirinaria sp. TL-2023a]